MSALRRGVTHLILAVVIGGTAGWGAVAGLSAWRHHQITSDPAQSLPPPGTRVQKAIDAIREDGVYVSPDGRDMVDRAGERKIEKAVADSHRPVHVIVWAPSTQDGDWLQVDEQLEREFDGEDALIYVWEGPEAGDVVEVGRTLDYPGSLDTQRNLTYSSDFVGDPATKLSEAALATKRATWDELPEPDSRGSLAAGGVVIGILLAVGAIAVIWVVMFGVRVCSGGRLRIPGQWTWTEGADRG